MKTYVVFWIDCCGRVRVKNYVYRACCEKFAVRLCVSGLAPSWVHVFTYENGRRVRSESTIKKGGSICRL